MGQGVLCAKFFFLCRDCLLRCEEDCPPLRTPDTARNTQHAPRPPPPTPPHTAQHTTSAQETKKTQQTNQKRGILCPQCTKNTLHKDRTGGDLFLFTHLTVERCPFLFIYLWAHMVPTTRGLLSSKEGARRTSLDQFRPLLNTNQISPVYDKLGLNLVCLMGSPPPPSARQRAPPRQLPCSVTREAVWEDERLGARTGSPPPSSPILADQWRARPAADALRRRHGRDHQTRCPTTPCA